jgi:hypothetical protein
MGRRLSRKAGVGVVGYQRQQDAGVTRDHVGALRPAGRRLHDAPGDPRRHLCPG